MPYSEAFYNDAESILDSGIRAEIHTIMNGGISCLDRRITNSELKSKLNELGWRGEFPIGGGKKIDFKKGEVGMEVEFRQDTNLLHDLLKLELASRRGLIKTGILVTYDRDVAIVGQHGMYASFQVFRQMMTEFEGIVVFRLPLWVIGLPPCQSSTE